MRIGTAQSAENFTEQLRTNSLKIEELRRQVSSGKRLDNPAEDPVASSIAVQVRSARASTALEQRMSDYAVTALGYNDGILQSISDTVQDMREQVIRGGTFVNAEDRKVLARQMEGMRDDLYALANRENGRGGLVFGGRGFDDPPFEKSAAGVIALKANYSSGTQQTGEALPFDLTLDAEGLFGENGGSNTPESVFDQLSTYIAAMKGTVPTGQTLEDIKGTTLDSLEQFLNRASVVRTAVGEQMRSLESRDRMLKDGDLRSSERLSQLIDTDYASALTDLSTLDMVNQAAMKSYTTVAKMTLFDYI